MAAALVVRHIFIPEICSILITGTLTRIWQPIILIWISSESILLFLKQDPEVAHLAATYLRYSVIGLPAYTFNAISRCVPRFPPRRISDPC